MPAARDMSERAWGVWVACCFVVGFGGIAAALVLAVLRCSVGP